MNPFFQRSASAFGKPVCRLGLASRGGSALEPQDFAEALERGMNFWNWPAESEGATGNDAMSDAIANLSARRSKIVVCIQFAARTAREAAGELRSVLSTLRTDYVDVVTMYYVEQPEEWEALVAPDGALTYCRAAQRDGVVRRIGITSHQRALAAKAAGSGLLDALMIRYNAAHRGAEREIFPITDAAAVPVIAYTALRWGALLRSTPDDPDDFEVPRAASWYRFALQSDSVAVTLAAPKNREELHACWDILHADGPLQQPDYELLAAHGQRVRKHAGTFP